MTTMTHAIRRHYRPGHDDWSDGWHNITLPAVPGVALASDRLETAPTLPTIRTPRRKPCGVAKAALEARKLNDVVSAICAARSAVLPTVTAAMEAGE